MFFCEKCGNGDCCERTDLVNEPVLCDECYAIEVYDGTRCVDADCCLNVDGICHDIGTILARIPSEVLSCSGAVIDFERSDYLYAIN